MIIRYRIGELSEGSALGCLEVSPLSAHTNKLQRPLDRVSSPHSITLEGISGTCESNGERWGI